MYISNHALGFAGQWGKADYVRADDLSEGFWMDVGDEEVGFDSDPLTLLIAAEEQGLPLEHFLRFV